MILTSHSIVWALCSFSNQEISFSNSQLHPIDWCHVCVKKNPTHAKTRYTLPHMVVQTLSIFARAAYISVTVDENIRMYVCMYVSFFIDFT